MSEAPERSYPPVRRDLSELAGKRVLVTGGAGFVGSNVTARLVDLGADVVVLDNFSTGIRDFIPSAVGEIVEADVADPAVVERCVEGVDYVFHMAAQNIILSTSELTTDFSTNIGGTLNVLLAASRLSSQPRVVYTSSASVYGNPSSLPISEDDGISILSPYAASKFAGESYCNAFYEMYELPVSIVRYSNVYGVNQTPDNPYCGVISKCFAACIEQRPIPIHGSGLQTRDLTYVSDAVEATLLAAVVPRAEGQILNVATGFETNIVTLAKLVSDVAGVECRTEFVDRRDIDNVQRRVLSIEKARRTLRWIPRVSLDRGLALTYEWLRRQ